MRTLILSDIHGNLPALRAILDTPAAQSCDRIISLGDHVNFGPQSREAHETLRKKDAIMLLGNHEERLLHPEDEAFAGYNWKLLHFTVRQMQGLDVNLPVDIREGPVWYTHGTPGDPYHFVNAAQMPEVLDALPEAVTHLISGHNHISWLVRHRGKVAFNPCSAGIPEEGEGGMAPFAVLEDKDGDILLNRHAARYDLREVARAYIETGAAAAAPEMCRAVYRTMCTGEYHGVTNFIRFIIDTGKEHGLFLADEEAWRLADSRWRWPEPVDSRTYWKNLEEELL